MEYIKVELTKSEADHIKMLLLDDILKVRKKLDKDIEENNKEDILKDFKNSIVNNSIQTKIYCGER